MFESTRVIGKLQYTKARELFEATAAHRRVRGPVHYIHKYVDMSSQPIYSAKGESYTADTADTGATRRNLT